MLECALKEKRKGRKEGRRGKEGRKRGGKESRKGGEREEENILAYVRCSISIY